MEEEVTLCTIPFMSPKTVLLLHNTTNQPLTTYFFHEDGVFFFFWPIPFPGGRGGGNHHCHGKGVTWGFSAGITEIPKDWIFQSCTDTTCFFVIIVHSAEELSRVTSLFGGKRPLRIPSISSQARDLF
jgi:hypothetical protein